MEINKIYNGNALKVLKTFPDNSVNSVITSPPYFNLRDYNCKGQIGLEKTPEEYIKKLVIIFREINRILKKEGTLWIVIGDSYNGSGKAIGQNTPFADIQKSNKGSILQMPTKVSGLKPKDLIGIPWELAFALRADGWYLRQDIIWHKPNPMPESVVDRCTKSFEYIFLLSKSKKYYYDYKSISEKSEWFEKDKRAVTGPTQSLKSKIGNYQCDKQGVFNQDGLRNKRNVWTVATKSFKDAHFAVFPEKLIVDCIKAGCPENGIVLDPFMGSGTTAVVARKLNRNFIGIELNKDYIAIANKRIQQEIGLFQ